VVNGTPAISYHDAANRDLKYVRATTASGTLADDWDTPTIADAGVQSGQVGLDNSQVIVNGHPAIAYYDLTNRDLKYMRALDAAGTSWGTPVTLDSTGNMGSYASMKVINGNPAISYKGDNTLKYVRALDASGTSWGAPVTLDSSGDMGTGTSLAVVNGNPAISYSGINIGSYLKYVRANTASGTLAGDWGTPVTILGVLGGAGVNAPSTSLAVVNGTPAISYSVVGGTLLYVRATTASGMLADDWDTPVVLDSSISSVGSPSLLVVSGNPAVSYYDSTNGNLKYVRATTASGTLAGNWGTPLTLDSTGTVGIYSSLAVVDGNPAISYYDSTNSNLKYVRATTTSGTSWGTPLTLDSSGDVGSYTSLAAVNGNPAISYYDSTNGNLKWATYGVTAPTVTMPTSENVTISSATLGGNVESDGGAMITERGVVYSLTSANANPLIGGSGVTAVTASGTTGVFTTAIGSLAAGSTYAFSAYATNSVGTSYTSAASFTTLTPGPEIAVFHGASTAPANERTDNIGTFGFGTVGTGSNSVAQTFTTTVSKASSS
jgi:hypothetical protein